MTIKAPRGTNDILPPVSLQWRYVKEVVQKILRAYNYQEILFPMFEYTELFQRGIGEITDIVEKEMYTFIDKGGRSITLRPEGTASVMRAFLEHKIYGQTQPTKYYYLGPMFRYERPQAGRFRQFHQLGVEVLGSNDPALDAEIIILGLNIAEELELNELEVYLNSIGCKECRADYVQALKEYLKNHREVLCSDCQTRLERNPLRVLDCKNEACFQVINNAPKITEYLCQDCLTHFNEVKKYLDGLDIAYRIDPTLVRGLDYYTNTVFEIKYKGLGAQDTICAGGRYNGLAEEIGNKAIPGIGFAIGLERLLLTIERQGIELPVEEGIDLYLVTIGNEAKKIAFKYVQKLRRLGLKTGFDYLNRGIKSQMKSADRMNATYTIILGEDELKNGLATIKNMKSGEQLKVELVKLVETMLKMV